MKNKILTQAKKDIPLYFNDFQNFWNTSKDNIEDEDLLQSYTATLIYKNWKIAFHSIQIHHLDIILDELFEDINSSFFLSLMGLYRSAHMHLRSSIELTLQLLFFVHHPIEFEKWKKEDYVIKHDEITQYLKTYPFFDIKIESLIDDITLKWKRFSKHIHGESPVFFQCEKIIRKTNSFSIADFNMWKHNFLQNIYNLNKLLLLFFKDKINSFPSHSRELLLSLLKPKDFEYFNLDPLGS